MNIVELFRDWWRGYGDDDIESLGEKMAVPRRPGTVIALTGREWLALRYRVDPITTQPVAVMKRDGWTPLDVRMPADGRLVVAKWAPHPRDLFQTIQVAYRHTGTWYAWHYGTFDARLREPESWTPIHADTPCGDPSRRA